MTKIDLTCTRCGGKTTDKPHELGRLFTCSGCGREIIELLPDIPASQVTVNITVGSGAVAVNGGVAAGEKGLSVGDSVYGPIVIG